MIASPLDSLWSAFLSSRSLEARNRLVEHYVADGLPKKVLGSTLRGRVKRGERHYVTYEVLASYANQGLLEGVESYNPGRGTQPQTWLTIVMRRAILTGLRELDPLTRRDRDKVKAGLMTAPAAASPASITALEGAGTGFEVRDETTALSAEDVRVALLALFKGMTPQTAEAILAYHFEGLSIREIVALRRARERIQRLDIVTPPEKFLPTLQMALQLMGLCDIGRHRRLWAPLSLRRAIATARDRFRQWWRVRGGECQVGRSRRRRN